MLRRYLPTFVNRELFGDRERFQPPADPDDADWQKWLKAYSTFYEASQASGAISGVNAAGYRVLERHNLEGLTLAEIGPGNGPHFSLFRGNPAIFHAFDVKTDFLAQAQEAASRHRISFQPHLLTASDPNIPLASSSVDVFLSFFSLEHLHPLDRWLDEIFRVLRPGGQLVGAIPAEGGIAWGSGRWLTTRRYLARVHQLDMKKIICWEHVNMCDEILAELRKRSELRTRRWPLPVLPLDLSLTIQLEARKN